MPESAGVGTMIALVLLIGASVYLGAVASRVVRRSEFLQSYFLGNRALGSWALALTATVQSGGSFMGFPSYVYSFGWIVALWIASYMVVPISAFGVIGKRFAQLSRRTGALTVPDLFRERFNSPTVGLVSSLLILFLMIVMMIAQFKAGALIMKICWPGAGTLALSEETGAIDQYYFYGLAIFTVTVVGYTLIGGFLAAVWTDLFQSIIMFFGVLILLPLALSAAGGLDTASRNLAEKVPFRLPSAEELAPHRPRRDEALRGEDRAKETLHRCLLAHYPRYESDQHALKTLREALWRYARSDGGRLPASIEALPEMLALPDDVQSRLTWHGAGATIVEQNSPERRLIAVLRGDADPTTEASRWGSVLFSNELIQSGRVGHAGDLVTGPGAFDFLPLGLAASFFCMWVFTGMASPSSMVRVMAANNTPTLRRSIYLLAIYNTAIYLPLVMICVAGRTLFPDLPAQNSDEIIPRMAIATTSNIWGGSFIAGLILAAPFGAVMATVSSYLVVIASGLVRDIYQRFIHPQASVRQLKLVSYGVMIFVGLVAVAANLRPPTYLQAIVVFSGTCGATAFVTPAIMTAFWRRATAAGMLAAMLGGSATTLALYIVGWINGTFGATFRPHLLFGLEPLIWGMLTSCLCGLIVSKLTQPPDAARISLCFDEKK